MNTKERISRKYLKGNGIEFGPLHNPLPVDSSNALVKYADRLTKLEALILFPELKDIEESIIEPDLIVDFNTDELSSLKTHNFDFIIANHFIEHLVNPIRFLEDVSHIMKPGSLFFLTVPDKDFTFDKQRVLTTNEHLWNDYLNKENEICNEHLKDFLLHKEAVSSPHPAVVEYFKKNKLPLSYYNGNKLPLNPFKRKRLYDFHRERSIHVHVWNKNSFDQFLNWINGKLKLGFEILDTHTAAEVEGEILYLLKKI